MVPGYTTAAGHDRGGLKAVGTRTCPCGRPSAPADALSFDPREGDCCTTTTPPARLRDCGCVTQGGRPGRRTSGRRVSELERNGPFPARHLFTPAVFARRPCPMPTWT